jgi:hypothetical protein
VLFKPTLTLLNVLPVAHLFSFDMVAFAATEERHMSKKSWRFPLYMRERREAAGYSLDKMALLTGFKNKSSLSRMETGEVQYNRTVLEAYAAILDCTPADFLTPHR